MPRVEISPDSRLRLMRMGVDRRTTEMAGLLLPPLLLTLYSQTGPPTALVVWAVAHAALAGLLYWSKQLFSRDEPRLDAPAMLAKWELRFTLMAGALGVAWGAPAWVVAASPPPEFVAAVLLVATGTTSSAVTYAAPSVFIAFVAFFVGCWLPMLAALHRLMPDHWLTLFILYAFHSAAVFKHAQGMRKFVVEQARLEEQAARLAEQYRDAKDDAERTLGAMNRFLVMASHDLRQPVHSMGMLVETVNIRNRDPAVAGLLSDLKSSASAVNLMFNSLLDLSRMDAGITVPQPVHVDLQMLLGEVQTLFGADAARRGLTLRIHPLRDSAFVTADPGLLRRAIYNLVHNALRYTTRGGVLLGVRKKAGYWHLQVWDTGIGLTAEVREAVFSPYYRQQHAWSLESEGHGLGLAVFARCAKAMDARHGLASRLGRGSMFWLALPVVAHETHRLTGFAPAPLQWPLRPLEGACLVVEDDPQVSAAWAALLQAWRVDVRVVSCALDAFGCLDAGFVPQVIFCDQRLRSGESGFELFRDLLKRCPEARGAMVSGDLASPDLARAEEEGYLVLQKPVQTDELHAVLSRWLGAR